MDFDLLTIEKLVLSRVCPYTIVINGLMTIGMCTGVFSLTTFRERIHQVHINSRWS